MDEKRIKDKARRWRGHLASVETCTADNVRVHFLVGGPRDESLRTAFEGAKVILSGCPSVSALLLRNVVAVEAHLSPTPRSCSSAVSRRIPTSGRISSPPR